MSSNCLLQYTELKRQNIWQLMRVLRSPNAPNKLPNYKGLGKLLLLPGGNSLCVLALYETLVIYLNQGLLYWGCGSKGGVGDGRFFFVRADCYPACSEDIHHGGDLIIVPSSPPS